MKIIALSDLIRPAHALVSRTCLGRPAASTVRWTAGLAMGLTVASAFAQAGIVSDGEAVAPGDTIQGVLEEGDLKHEEDNSFFDPFVMEVEEGQTYILSLSSDAFDSLLFLFDENGEILELNDDAAGETQTLDARIEFTAKESGTVVIYANTVYSDGTGAYTLTVE